VSIAGMGPGLRREDKEIPVISVELRNIIFTCLLAPRAHLVRDRRLGKEVISDRVVDFFSMETTLALPQR
jgi:hypothetical protein